MPRLPPSSAEMEPLRAVSGMAIERMNLVTNLQKVGRSIGTSSGNSRLESLAWRVSWSDCPMIRGRSAAYVGMCVRMASSVGPKECNVTLCRGACAMGARIASLTQSSAREGVNQGSREQASHEVWAASPSVPITDPAPGR